MEPSLCSLYVVPVVFYGCRFILVFRGNYKLHKSECGDCLVYCCNSSSLGRALRSRPLKIEELLWRNLGLVQVKLAFTEVAGGEGGSKRVAGRQIQRRRRLSCVNSLRFLGRQRYGLSAESREDNSCEVIKKRERYNVLLYKRSIFAF